jgi:diguanylate cyclase (GGDEF)-like protein
MKIKPLRALKSTIGLRTMAQFAAVAVLPIGALAALLLAQGTLSPDLAEALEVIGACGAVFGVGLGVLQSYSLVRRIDRLIRSTRRIGRQDFSALVPQEGSDEVAVLSRAFNEMARNLGTSLAVQGILAQMDDAILTKLDVGALIRSALRCMRHVTQAEVVVLGLFETDTAESMRVFVMKQGERSRIDSEKLEMRAELKRRIPLKPTSQSAAVSPFPEAFEARLREQCGTGNFYAVPISRGNRAWGVMVSCHSAPATLDGGQLKMLNGVSNRLIAGFSGSERDQKLHSLAYVDPLTGLPNRVAMQSLLAQELDNAQRNKALAAILFIDLDRFKQANDTHGHAFGDRLLIQAANRIRNNVREDDIVARIGGDEFTVILPGVKNPREAASVSRKLIQSLSRRFEIDGHTIYTGASVGIAMYPDDGVRGPELLKMADTAMYRAKSAGRSRFAFYEEPMNAESKRRTVLDGELRNALERNELVLHYQPQIDLKTGALCGVEALVRWQHPTRGLLFPLDFIEYAEEIGLIPEIGGWVMAEACRQFKAWREEGVRVPRVSVNVSNGQLPRTNFVPTVQQLIAATQMPPGSLEIEVTESMLVEGGKPAIEALNQLAKDGVLIAIDDFGTGYSSFSYLKTMPAQVLKLDMSFLVDAREDNDAGKIVAAIINMAHALQKEVVAEGIERVDQLKLLKTLGCERGQGYLFGKGVPAENIARTFRKIDLPDPPPPRIPQSRAASPFSDVSAAGTAVAPPLPHAAVAPSAALPLPAIIDDVPRLPESAPAATLEPAEAAASPPEPAELLTESAAQAIMGLTARHGIDLPGALTREPAALGLEAEAEDAPIEFVLPPEAPATVDTPSEDLRVAAPVLADGVSDDRAQHSADGTAAQSAGDGAVDRADYGTSDLAPEGVGLSLAYGVADGPADGPADSAADRAAEGVAENAAGSGADRVAHGVAESVFYRGADRGVGSAADSQEVGPADGAADRADSDADVAFDFPADHAVSYAAEFAETLAAHRAAQDAVLPSVAFVAIAPALPSDEHVPADARAIAAAPEFDPHSDYWPIEDQRVAASGNGANAAPASSAVALPPANVPLRLQERAAAHI